MILFLCFFYLVILLNYMGDVISFGEFCVLLDGVIFDLYGSDEKLKNLNGEVIEFVVGVLINSLVLFVVFLVSWVFDF